ncbi:hypothetical protein EV291_13951 [Rhizobium sp. BK068]|nr:hypothetical protein EV291_13951 [Rhizobium sp. BK068]
MLKLDEAACHSVNPRPSPGDPSLRRHPEIARLAAAFGLRNNDVRNVEPARATPQQRNTVIASYLGGTLDAFDFLILVFVLKYIAEEFHTDVPAVSDAFSY